jgi:hypothetical protein
MIFDVSYEPGQGWAFGCEDESSGSGWSYGYGDSLAEAFADLVKHLGSDPTREGE